MPDSNPKSTNPRPVSSLFLLAAQYDARVYLSLEEVCDVLGIAVRTAYGWLQVGTFPMPFSKQGNRIVIDIRDLAEHLDKLRDQARAEHSKKHGEEKSEA